jgi:hypothetical protein
MINNKLYLTEDFDNIPHKALVNALNVMYNSNFTYLINENGYIKLHTFDNKICGVISTPNCDIVFTSNNSNISRIYKITDESKILLLQGNFKFHTDNAIIGVYDYNNNGDLIIAWIDGVNPACILNTDNYITYDETVILPDNYIDTIYLFPNISMPKYNLDKVRSGGNINKAAYYFIVNYYINDYDLSNWLIPSNPIYIFDIDSDIEQSYYAYEKDSWEFSNKSSRLSNKSYDSYQSNDNNISNKSIIMNIANLDTRYSKLKVAIIQKTDTSTKVFDIGDYIINSTELQIVYDGTNKGELTLNEVTIPYISYNSPKSITKLNGRLLLGNIQSSSINSYQKYANNIKVTYDIEEIEPNSSMAQKGYYNYYDNENNCFYLKTVTPDEVYALYIGLIGKDGTNKGNYHIPGRHHRDISSSNGIVFPAGITENTLLSNPLLKGIIPDKYNNIDSSVKIFHLFDTADNRVDSIPASCNFYINTIDINSIPGNRASSTFSYANTNNKLFSITFNFNTGSFIENGVDTITISDVITINDLIDGINNSNSGYNAEFIDNYSFKILAPLSYGYNGNFIVVNYDYSFVGYGFGLESFYIINGFITTLTGSDSSGSDTYTNINIYISGILIGYYTIKPNDTISSIHNSLNNSINNIALYTSNIIDNKIYIYPDILLGPDVINNEDYKLSITKTGTETFITSEYFTGGNYNNYHGYLGYWENKDEYYSDSEDSDIYEVDIHGIGQPVTTGDDLVEGVATLRNKNVRHHKMPSYNYIYNNNDAINRILSLKLYDIQFPNDILNDIQGFVIMYAARNTSNMTIVGTCPLIRDNYYDTFSIDKYNSKYIRFNDPSLINTKTQIGKSYIKTLYSDIPIINPISPLTNQFTKIGELNTDIHTVKSAKYIPYDNSATTPDNSGREESLMLELDYSYYDIDNKKVIANLCIFNPNVFSSFYNQELCIIGNINLVTEGIYKYTVDKLKGFDTYLNTQLIRLYRGNQQLIYNNDEIDRYNGDDSDGTTVFNEFSYTSYSIINILARNVIPIKIDITSKKNTGIIIVKNHNLVYRSIFSIDPGNPDSIVYNKFYSSVNNIKAFKVYNPSNVLVLNHTNRIARSAVQGKESLVSNWRYFSTLEYYEIIKDKGEIINIQGIDDILLIHTNLSLFVTKLKDKLELTNEDIYLGQADIFDREPKELKPSESAYCGIQSRLSAKLTDLGYIFYNPYSKSIYVYNNDGFLNINNESNNDYIKLLFNDSKNVNSLYNDRVLFGEDTEFKRIFIVNINDSIKSNLSFTYHSYKDLSLISKHTPIPILYFNNIRGNYCVDETGLNIYKTNIGDKGNYFDETINESYIDIIFNPDNIHKQLQSLTFITSNDNSNKLNAIIVYTKNQCSKRYTIEEFNSILDYNKIRFNKGRWNYNLIRDYTSNEIVQNIIDTFELNESVIDEGKEWFELSMIEDKYFVVRLISNNNDIILFKDLECNYIKL